MTNPRENPYVGPRAFTTADQDRLFGRDRDIKALYRLLISERIVLLLSPSGAGKTSLVQAGLVPRMQEKGFDILPVIRVKQDIPDSLANQAGLNRYVLSTLLSLDEDEHLPAAEGVYEERLAALTLKQYLDLRLKAANQVDKARADHSFLLVFDQFEEILSVAPDDLEGKRTFFAQLGEALEEKNFWAIFIAREESSAALAPYLRFIPTQLTNSYRLDLLEYEAAKQAIRKPAQLRNVLFTDEATEKLTNDLRRIYIQRPDGSWEPESQVGHYVEPVQLQVVCYKLWDQIGDANQIDEQHIESLGNVNEALAGYYAEQVNDTAAKTGISQQEIRYWFGNQLITRSGIRSQVMWEEEQSGGLNNEAILMLERSHLIRGETRRGVKWYELVHDRLIEPIINNNKEWFDKNLSILQRQAMQWEIQDKPDHLLLRYEALDEAEQWAADNPLNPTEAAFLQESQNFRSHFQTIAAEKEAEQQRQRAEELGRLNRALKKTNDRLNVGNFFIMGLAALAIFAAMFGFSQMTFATSQASLAEEQKIIAQAAEATAQADRQTAQDQRNIAITEQQKAQSEAERADREAKINLASKLATQSLELSGSYAQRAILLALEALRTTDGTGISNAELSVLNSGLRSALGSNQGLLLSGHKDSIRSLAFSQDEHWLATAGDIVQIWDLFQPDPTAGKQVLRDMPATSAVQFSPDGKWLATATISGDIYIWKMPLGERPEALKVLYAGQNVLNRKTGEMVNVLAFSPGDGHWLASASNQGTTLLWDMTSLEQAQPARISLLSSGVRAVNVLAFSPDGKWLASGNDDNIVRLWKVEQPGLLPFPKTGALGPIQTLSFSPDSAYLAAGSDKDNAVYIWNVNIPENKAITLQKSKTGVQAVMFNPLAGVERQLAAGFENGETQYWNGRQDYFENKPQSLATQEGAITAMVFSPDAHWLASSSKDSSVLLWDWLNPQTQPLRLQSLTKAITALQFSPQSHWLAIGSEDHTVRLWNLPKDILPVEPVVVSNSDNVLAGIAGDSRTYLTIDNQKKTINIWDLSEVNPTLKQSVAVPQIKNPITQATLYESTLAVGAATNGVAGIALIDLSTPETRILNLSNISGLTNLSFSPDGKTLLAAGSLQLKVWQTAVPEQALINYQTDSGESIKTVLFSQDSRWLIAHTTQPQNQSQLLLWNLSDPKPVRQVLSSDQGNIVSFDISPDGRWLAAGSSATDSAGGTVLLWNLAHSDALPVELGGHTGWVNSARFSPDSQWLATSDDKGVLLLWELLSVKSGPVKKIATRSSALNSTRFSADGQWLASGNQDGSVLLLNLAGARADAPDASLLLLGHEGPVSNLDFSPDNLSLATSGDDGTVRLWSLADAKDGKSVVVKGYQGSPLYAARFSFDGRYLLAYAANNALELVRVRLEDVVALACQAVGRNLTEQEWGLYLPQSQPRSAICPQYPLP